MGTAHRGCWLESSMYTVNIDFYPGVVQTRTYDDTNDSKKYALVNSQSDDKPWDTWECFSSEADEVPREASNACEVCNPFHVLCLQGFIASLQLSPAPASLPFGSHVTMSRSPDVHMVLGVNGVSQSTPWAQQLSGCTASINQ